MLAHSLSLALIVIPLLLTSCLTLGASNPFDNLPTRCTPNSALIGVYDGILESRCGCAEGVHQVGAGTTLKCTVSVNTLIVFDFTGSLNPHQIISTGSPNFVSSHAYHPDLEFNVPSHSVVLKDAGTYHFHDGFNTEMKGEIIVN